MGSSDADVEVIDITGDDSAGDDSAGEALDYETRSQASAETVSAAKKRSREQTTPTDSLRSLKAARRSASASANSSRSESRSPSPSIGERRVHRKTEERVLFSDIMAQEREMARIANENRVAASTSHVVQPRKGEKSLSPVDDASTKLKRQKRAELRRSQRQALRRVLSPCSPDGKPLMDLRGGVPMVNLDDVVPPRKRRFARNEDAIQDTHVHSTAWRNVRFEAAPINLVPTRADIPEPFALTLERSLGDYDADLAAKCVLSSQFGHSKPLTLTSGSTSEMRSVALLEDQIRELMEEATPLVKKCNALRANVLLASTRKQVASYLAELPALREKARSLGARTAMPLEISRLEKVAVRKILKQPDFARNDMSPPWYTLGRTEAMHQVPIHPKVTYLSTIKPVRRSTTCVLSRGTYRVEDDPIIRFVPYFSAASKGKTQPLPFSGMEPRKETLAGLDDEVNEYILRYVVARCGADPVVFDALRRTDKFTQPLADYSSILQRVGRERLREKLQRRAEALADTESSSGHANEALKTLLAEYKASRAGIHLRERLQSPPTCTVFNHLQEDGLDCGVRAAASGRYEDVVVKYREFFCRLCCTYNCRNHGRNQPLPAFRADPSYPTVKHSRCLWRRVEEQQTTTNGGREPSKGEERDANANAETKEAAEPEQVREEGARPENAGEQKNHVQDEDHKKDNDALTRRSVRAQTAASTKASSQLRAQQHEKKKLSYAHVRADPQADVSEYLGFDSVYRGLTQSKKVALLSPSIRCGSHCVKPVADDVESTDTLLSTPQRPWGTSEIVLLSKLEQATGSNPCVLSAMLATRTCAEVAGFLQQRDAERKEESNDFSALEMQSNGLLDPNRERSNGVLGNNHEHLRRTRLQRMKDKGANHEYVPCNHDGSSCNTAQCSCMRRDHYCEKACGCSRDCANRFPGCHCKPGECRTSACPCYFASRECDPDICVSCGASELPVVLADEESKHKSLEQLKLCGNVNIMHGRLRKVGVSASDTHGWGAYALENIKKGDFMYEYTGSVLSQDEAERRGNVYDKSTISFLFDLTEDSVVDATRKGNKSKFANHDSDNPVCFARIMLVNGDHRIGIFAKKDIAVGDEIFFDYGHHGVIPDWSQARIGTTKSSLPNEVEAKVGSVVKQGEDDGE